MTPPDPLRRHLATALDWGEARVPLPAVFDDVPPDLRGRVPDGLPYSLWQLLEHIRLAQRDLLEFSRDPDYDHPEWPADYWPSEPEPPEAKAWEQSLAAYQADLSELRALVTDPETDLSRSTPSGSESQTFLRSVLLVVDHTAYHVGQAVVVRRLLGAW